MHVVKNIRKLALPFKEKKKQLGILDAFYRRLMIFRVPFFYFVLPLNDTCKYIHIYNTNEAFLFHMR